MFDKMDNATRERLQNLQEPQGLSATHTLNEPPVMQVTVPRFHTTQDADGSGRATPSRHDHQADKPCAE